MLQAAQAFCYRPALKRENGSGRMSFRGELHPAKKLLAKLYK
jgi:hypothetical protein